METLFLDNYRGFKETYIPIKDVNFLVGENSTGKTSVLAIVNLLADHSFWTEQQFNSKSVQLGTFNDIASIGSQNTSDFKIGWMHAAEEDADSFAFLARFGQRNGLPCATHFDFYKNGTVINMVISEGSVQYRKLGRKLGEDKNSSLQGLMNEWQSGVKLRRDFKTLKFPMQDFPFQQSLLISMQIIEHKTRIRSKDYSYPIYFSMQNVMSNLTWLAPIRSQTRRTYDDYKTDFAPDGSHTPYLVRRLLNSPKIAVKFRDFIREFGKKSGLLDSIAIRQFGKTDVISPFALDIEIDGKKLNIKNVGYGISQALPVVVEIYEGPRGGWFAIQQPEIHLHPRAQAALGDLVYSCATKDKKKFLIETHSDYTIDRFCSNYRKKDKHRARPDAQVLFFKRTSSGNEVYPVLIDSLGDYSTDQPKEFREFFIKEQLNTLGIRS